MLNKYTSKEETIINNQKEKNNHILSVEGTSPGSTSLSKLFSFNSSDAISLLFLFIFFPCRETEINEIITRD